MHQVSRRRSVFINFLGSGLNTLIISLQGIVLIPFYLRELGPRLYGAWLGTAELLIWMQVLDVGIQGLMIQRIGDAHGKGDYRAVGTHFASGMTVMVLIAGIAAALGAALSFPLPMWLGLSGQDAAQLRVCFQTAALATAAIIVSNSAAGLARGTQSTTLMNVALTASSLAGLICSIVLLFTGWGLWSIALGIVARATVSLALNALFVVRAVHSGACGPLRPRRDLLKEYLQLFPMSALGGVGYGVMNQSDAMLIGLVLDPSLAPIYTLTRKCADIARSCVDTIGQGSYGSFAHLVGSPQRHRVLDVHAEIRSLWIALALAAAIAYMVVNASLISTWVSPDLFGGKLLTILFALQMLTCGCSHLLNLLFRASGQVRPSIRALVLESLFRLPLMICLLLWLGLPGLPLAAMITSVIAAAAIYRLTVSSVSAYALPPPRNVARVFLTRGSLLLAGMLACALLAPCSLEFVLIAGCATGTASCLFLVYGDPMLTRLRAPFSTLLVRFGGRRRNEHA